MQVEILCNSVICYKKLVSLFFGSVPYGKALLTSDLQNRSI